MAAGCGGPRDYDYYSELQELGTCDNLLPKATVHVASQSEARDAGVDLKRTFLTQECFEDIKTMFELDSSFLKLSELDQMRILEAAVTVYNTPLAIPPKGSIFSKAIPNKGILSGAMLCLFKPDIDEDCLNYREEEGPIRKFVFNYIMNNLDVIYYDDKAEKVASYTLDDFLLNGRITFTANFLGTSPILANNYRTPYLRAATMVHEARHREIMHDGIGASDDETIGSYGFTLGYLAAVLFGSYDFRHPETGEFLLSDYDIQLISSSLCSLIRDDINYINPELKKWTQQVGCWGPNYDSGTYRYMELFLYLPQQNHDANWWLEQNGLNR